MTSRTVDHQVHLFMGFPRQKYRSRLPFPSPGDLLDQGIEPGSPALGFPGSSAGKNLPRSPREGNGNTLQYSCLENPMDRGVWQAPYSPWGCRVAQNGATKHSTAHSCIAGGFFTIWTTREDAIYEYTKIYLLIQWLMHTKTGFSLELEQYCYYETSYINLWNII